jgi:hypothetical protein
LDNLLDKVPTQRGYVVVVRHDKIEGGTKRLALTPLLSRSTGVEYVYATSAYGYAQVALAVACRETGNKATIFTAKRKTLSPYTKASRVAGAKIVLVPYGYLTNVQAKARKYAVQVGANLIPFGIGYPAFEDELVKVAESIREQVGSVPEVWSVAGSGTLTRALQRVWPEASFYAVQIGHDVSRKELGNAKRLDAPEVFERSAKRPPPFASCTNYDAKAWQFVNHQAASGALFWNVAA